MSVYPVISDIHGNLTALRNAWRIFESYGLSDGPIFNAGDTVAYGACSDECIEFVRAHPNIVSVAGNYDNNVLHFPEKAASFERKWGVTRPEKFEAIRTASESIGDDSRQWLATLPSLIEITVEGKDLAVCHYAPGTSKQGLGDWTPDQRLEEIAESTGYDIIITGHTHSQFERTAANTLFVNPGSLGRGWSGEYYALLEIGLGGRVQAEVKRCDLP